MTTTRKDTKRADRRAVAVLAATACTLAWLVAGPSNAEAARRPGTTVGWKPCPAYSDDVIRAQGVPAEQIPQYRALLNRMECGTVTVPLDYRRPYTRQLTIAITRLRAVDQAHRLGSLAVNPGGPGGSGYLTPIKIVMFNQESARLNDRYDLIGFDPRGVNYSTKVNCPVSGPGQPPAPGPLTEEAARLIYLSEVTANDTCGRSDPDFLSQLTTLNVASDLDRVRIALGERKLSFLGMSWGTRLGAAYRSTFPGSVGRMFLDSVVDPRFRLDKFAADSTAARERNFARLAQWAALRHDTYHLGSTPEEVRAAVLALRQRYDAAPKRFTDLPMPIDGAVIANLAGQNAIDWPQVSQAFKELRESTGSTAPASLKEIFGGGPTIIVPGAPEIQNPTMRQAASCNEEPARPDFSTAWAAYRRRIEENPVTGPATRFSADCAGWPISGRGLQLHRTGGSLVLSGHRYESGTPFEWTQQMQSVIGGAVFTIGDDMHAAALKMPDCAAKLVSYFATGRTDEGCTGFPVP